MPKPESIMEFNMKLFKEQSKTIEKLLLQREQLLIKIKELENKLNNNIIITMRDETI